jgi:hypothetical protein
MLSAIATAIKGLAFSPDGREATFILVTKYSGDIEITLPASCLQQIQPALARAFSTSPDDETQQPVKDPAAPNVSVRVPKKWLVGADRNRSLVIAVLNHQMPDQYAFAFDRKSALDLAEAVVKQANSLEDHSADPAPQSDR